MKSNARDLAIELENVIYKIAASTYTRQDELITLGNEAYRPRVLRSLDKNDVLNQVIEILNGEE